jgi:hypothetical protein
MPAKRGAEPAIRTAHLPSQDPKARITAAGNKPEVGSRVLPACGPSRPSDSAAQPAFGMSRWKYGGNREECYKFSPRCISLRIVPISPWIIAELILAQELIAASRPCDRAADGLTHFIKLCEKADDGCSHDVPRLPGADEDH